ncbi:hypothetical protein [Nocardioides sp. CER19]|uniref:hypothetical protein n=1 Tax=Nocardioides sp. CER19 TaxID=3038538 RepID=UPI00244A7B67|nr:hypothetical protein [Nocardioides sp. CER19]MDH2412969.1 hypothetical protein [Nocardioides sp. CER19]
MSTTPGDLPARESRNGRPYRPPEERVAPEASVVDRRTRTAWLLGTTRMLARGGSFAQRRDFVAALTDRGVSCDASRLSRWESGTQGVGTSVLAAYEDVLGVPTYQMRGALDLVRAPRTPAYGVIVEDDDVDLHPRLDELLNAALEGRASGLEWLELAQRVIKTDAVYLREADWQVLARVLVNEFCRSASTGFIARTSALRKLIAYPRAQRHLLLAIGEVILDERVARRAEPVHLFTRIPGRHASRLALRLVESEDPPVRIHATRTLAALLADGGFDGADSRLVETLVRQLRQDPGSFELADAAAQLPQGELEQVQAAVRSKALHQVLATHEIVARDTAATCARQVTATANPTSARPRIESDGMLTHLIRDGLFHSHFRRRASALGVLAASQYAGRVGQGFLELLGHRDHAVVESALEGIAWLVDDSHADTLAEVAASSRPPSERRLALSALGRLPSDPSAQVIQTVVGCLSDAAGEVRRAAVAMLGMHGHADQVRGVDPQLDAAAQWWLDQGPRLAR